MSKVAVSTTHDRKAAKAKLLALYQANEGWSERCSIAAAWCIGLGFFGAAYEGFRWLQRGSWEPERTWQLGRAVIDEQWLDAPTSWLGLHRMVVGFLNWPLFITGPLLAILAVGLVWVMFQDHYERKIKALQEEHNVYDSHLELLGEEDL